MPVAAAALVACSSGSTPSVLPSTGAGGQHIAVSEKEFAITLASKPTGGLTTFDVKNDGAVAHEFVIVKTDLAQDKLPQASGEVDEDQLDALGEVEDVAPGTTKSFTVDLAAGHYVVFCNVPGHYPAGMHQEVSI
jgi:uncharacterized cupredoxin-like copper-binding protein